MKECRQLLREYRDKLDGRLRKSGQQDEAHAVMLLRGFEFGIRTVQGMDVLTAADEDNALLACTLCRPFYETAVRLLWATRTHNGWQRLQVHWAQEDVKWAREAEQIPSVAEHAKTIRADREEVLSRTDDDGNPFAALPSVRQMLQEVSAHDEREGLRTQGDGAAEFDYTNFYRILCRAAHGNMVAIGRPASFRRHARWGALMAVWALVQAGCHVAADDPISEIKRAGERVTRILQDDRHA